MHQHTFVHRFSQRYSFSGSYWAQLSSKVLLPQRHLKLVRRGQVGQVGLAWQSAEHLWGTPEPPQGRDFPHTFPHTGIGSRHLFLGGMLHFRHASVTEVCPHGHRSTISGESEHGSHAPTWQLSEHLWFWHDRSLSHGLPQENATTREVLESQRVDLFSDLQWHAVVM